MAARFAAWPWFARVLAPVVLGVFAALGHESWASGFVAVTSAFVLALLLLPVVPRRAALFGWLMGFGYFAFTLRWIVEPFFVDVARHGWIAPFAIGLMAGGLALFWALAFWAARWLAGQGAAVAVWLPVTMTAAELLRGHVFTGFPWGLVSYTLVGGPADVWFAFVGPHGTGLLLLGVAGGVAYAVQGGRMLVWAGLAVVVMATFGANALSRSTALADTDSTVRLVQPNAPQHLKWDRAWMPVFFDRAIAQTMAGDPADVVIWPETSVPALLNNADGWLQQMALAAKGAPVVAGIMRRTGEDFFNSLIVIEGPGDVSDVYDKTHLVPFGEYMPFEWLLEPIGFTRLVQQGGGFVAGDGSGFIDIAGLGLARVLICYEGIFPEDMQRGEARADVLLIITNDAWFGKGAGPRQHLVQAQARAIEQGLPVVRAANTGISAVIDPRGRIAAQLGLNEAGYLDAAVPAPLPPTLYARTGDWPLTVLLVLATLTGATIRRRFAIDGASARH
ncbi:MAG: apolipoprotein N-acyltransferase [Octadecabacter sp.]|nr:apolipoprotein N-acyltransferase [Octadecabacter sp.]